MDKYITLEKAVGETPLSCAEAYRAEHPELLGVPMSYAGRLDPMASGKLLILLGEECKNQTTYHGLDKEYEFSVLLGIESDSLDVLGRLPTPELSLNETKTKAGDTPVTQPAPLIHPLLPRSSQAHPSLVSTSLSTLADQLGQICHHLTGDIELPYPRFSAKTVQGKPLHMWTLEGRLDEIEIPTKGSTVYSLELKNIETKTRAEVCAAARTKIDTIPEVTEARKALGNDFRRADVRADWERVATSDTLPGEYLIANFTCIASSGTYMRTLASVIANQLNTVGLAWNIHRTVIGTYDPTSKTWTKAF